MGSTRRPRFLPSHVLPSDASALRLHKYSGVDNSLLSRHVLGTFWTWLVEWVPLWVAPNLVTFTGFLFIVLNFLLMVLLVPDFDSPGPPPLYISMGVGLFIYQSLDAIDGKQARRTSTSSPLGELFDHGCDALNTGLAGIMGLQAMGLGAGWWSVAVLFSMFSNFYCSTWETYHTHVLYLSPISGPVEGVIASVLAFLVAGVMGQEFYKQRLCDLSGALPCGITLSKSCASMVFGLSVFNVLTSLWNVARLSTKKQPTSHDSHPLTTFVPLPAFFALSASWYFTSPGTLTPILFLPFSTALSIAFGYQVGLIVLAHCAKRTFPLWNVLFSATALAALLSALIHLNLLPLSTTSTEDAQETLVYTYLATTVAVYIYFAWDVVHELCAIFDIWCFRIKPRARGGATAGKARTMRKTGVTVGGKGHGENNGRVSRRVAGGAVAGL